MAADREDAKETQMTAAKSLRAGSETLENRSLFREDGLVVIPPFETVALDVGLLLGDDEPDDTSP